MFPNAFSARVAERMVVWGCLLGFLLALYCVVEAIRISGMAEILNDRQQATAALVKHMKAEGVVDAAHNKIGLAIAKRVQSLDERQSALMANHRQNRLLIGLLALVVVVQIFVLEYRWLVKPIVRLVAVLRTGDTSWRDLIRYASRRDEIGAFAQALLQHFNLVQRQQDMASRQQLEMEDRLSRQESFRTASLSFRPPSRRLFESLKIMPVACQPPRAIWCRSRPKPMLVRQPPPNRRIGFQTTSTLWLRRSATSRSRWPRWSAMRNGPRRWPPPPASRGRGKDRRQCAD